MYSSMIVNDIFKLSAYADNSILFESMWPLPYGVSLNSYIVKGKDVAIIDGFCGWDGYPETLFSLLENIDIKLETIKYVVINHLEPDHSGWLEAFYKLHQNFIILVTSKGVPLIKSIYKITENIQPVKQNDLLNLGNNKILEFIEIPNVHWPETMATYEKNTHALFSCDAFGSFGTLNKDLNDENLSENELLFFENESRRYYSNILGAFSISVKQALNKLQHYEVKIIAPGHGPVWTKNPNRIFNLYADFAESSSNPHNNITILWSSMYGMTQKAVSHIESLLQKRKIPYDIFQIPQAHISHILSSVWNSKGIILAMPTYEYKMFPPMAYILEEIGRKKAFNRICLRVGSYGWSGGAQKEMEDIISRNKMNWECLKPVEFQGSPNQSDYDEIEQQMEILLRKLGK